MADVRIEDLSQPVLNELQRSAIAYGETLRVEFDADDILTEASRATGLTNFGADDFRARLGLLCAEWGNDTGLTGLGRHGLRQRAGALCK